MFLIMQIMPVLWIISRHLPPVADEDLLVEDGPVRTDEGGGVEAALVQRITQTHVVSLTLGLWISVVASEDEAGTGE